MEQEQKSPEQLSADNAAREAALKTEGFAWNDLRYSVKPFTPRVFFEISEHSYEESQAGTILSGSNRVAINALLLPLDGKSRIALMNGKLVESLFDAEGDDIEKAFAFMQGVRFLSTQYAERGNKLLNAQKDLGPDLLRAKPLTSESPTASETAQGSSGPAEET